MSKKTSPAFLIEVAIDEFNGVPMAKTAVRLKCSLGTLHKARNLPGYQKVYDEVYERLFDARFATAEEPADETTPNP